MSELRINGERLWQSLMQMARIGATEKGGVCRLALSEEDLQARELLSQWCEHLGMEIRFGVPVSAWEETGTGLDVIIGDNKLTVNTERLAICTNAFTTPFLDGEPDFKPGRGQVLVTEPLPDGCPDGNFHAHLGFYYMRNVADRVLIGGGRHLDIDGETTLEEGTTGQIQQDLEEKVCSWLGWEQMPPVDHRWSGPMAFGDRRQPVIRPLAPRVVAGYRLGGMGVALGTEVGERVARMIDERVPG